MRNHRIIIGNVVHRDTMLHLGHDAASGTRCCIWDTMLHLCVYKAS